MFRPLTRAIFADFLTLLAVESGFLLPRGPGSTEKGKTFCFSSAMMISLIITKFGPHVQSIKELFMSDYQIITDSGCDLPNEVLEKLDLKMVSLSLIFRGKTQADPSLISRS